MACCLNRFHRVNDRKHETKIEKLFNHQEPLTQDSKVNKIPLANFIIKYEGRKKLMIGV